MADLMRARFQGAALARTLVVALLVAVAGFGLYHLLLGVANQWLGFTSPESLLLSARGRSLISVSALSIALLMVALIFVWPRPGCIATGNFEFAFRPVKMRTFLYALEKETHMRAAVASAALHVGAYLTVFVMTGVPWLWLRIILAPLLVWLVHASLSQSRLGRTERLALEMRLEGRLKPPRLDRTEA